MAAEHPAERSVRGAVHGTCPPPAATTGHKPAVPSRCSQAWACPTVAGVARLRVRLEPASLG
ncbi:hypothetical protein C8D78_1782 [Arthrobacter oryzae]|uniref:Uncharacterized protein n=1 Tax=Arthrobacter oryzae TaxID=409290 RepID=A0A495ESI6_9MICC|nr:hypothetical protein C8D78_1782 [Arthrobacter oryzae]